MVDIVIKKAYIGVESMNEGLKERITKAIVKDEDKSISATHFLPWSYSLDIEQETQDSKSWEKNNPTLGKSTKYSQEEYNPSNIGE